MIFVGWITKGREMSGACDCPAVSTHLPGCPGGALDQREGSQWAKVN